FADDVAAADEFALNVKLRDGRPLGIGLDALTQLVVLEHVKTLIGHAKIIEDLHDLAGEAAHRKLRRALHEQHHLVSLDRAVDELIDRHSRLPCWAAGKTLPRRIPSARRAIYVAQNGYKAHAADFMVKWRRLCAHLDAAERAYRRMNSRSDRAALALRRSGLQRQGVQRAPHFGLERLVDDLVLLDP